MSKACCQQQKNYKNAVKLRSFFLLALGILMMVPSVEAVLTAGWLGYVALSCLSVFMGYSVLKDFSCKAGYIIVMFCVVGFFIYAPLIPGVLLSDVLLAISGVLCAVFLFIGDEAWSYLGQIFLSLFVRNIEKSKTLERFFEWPSTEKIVLLFIYLNWFISFGSFLVPTSIIFSNVLHDGLLTLGAYILGVWFSQSMQMSHLAHNHKKVMVTLIDEQGDEYNKPVSELKAGDKIRITQETFLPIACTVIRHNCTIQNTGSEQLEIKQVGDSIIANTRIKNGIVECIEDYVPVNRSIQKGNAEAKDMVLIWFLVMSFFVALLAGIGGGFFAGSVIVGMQMFCLNLMVACPCVFLVIKPILQRRVLDWVTQKSGFHFNKMPSVGRPDIIVFDRTNTLYEPDLNNPNGAYILNKGVKHLFRRLIAQGVELYIISGHGTGNWQEHLWQCQQEFREVGVASDHIIFDRIYHDSDRKKEVINNLQRYGQIDSTGLEKLFRRKVVAMVGDGDNDIPPMKQADFAVCVGKNMLSFNSNVAKEANFIVDQKNLPMLSCLVEVMGDGHRVYNRFAFFSFFYHALLMLAINLFPVLFGVAFPPAVACLAVLAFCGIVSAFAYRVRLDAGVGREDAIPSDMSVPRLTPQCECSSAFCNKHDCCEVSLAPSQNQGTVMKLPICCFS